MNITGKIHTFDNGLQIFDYHLSDIQRHRYTKRNVHEAEEEDIFIHAINEVRPTGTFVNIGTAFGYYPLLARKLRADVTIWCVEPLSIHIHYFKENIFLNRFHEDDFTIIQKVIGPSRGVAQLHVNSYSSSISIEAEVSLKEALKKPIKSLMHLFRFKPYSVIEIESITLSDLCGMIPSKETIDLVQMDVQGAESAILKEFFKTDCGTTINSFIIGTHGSAVHKRCLKYLVRNKYSILHSEPKPRNQPDGIIYASIGHQSAT